MLTALSIGTVLLMTSSLSYAIILRPRWYPYFLRPGQVARGSGTSSDLSSLIGDSVESRHVRMAENEQVPICDARLRNEECLNQLVELIARLLKSGSRGNSYL